MIRTCISRNRGTEYFAYCQVRPVSSYIYWFLEGPLRKQQTRIKLCAYILVAASSVDLDSVAYETSDCNRAHRHEIWYGKQDSDYLQYQLGPMLAS